MTPIFFASQSDFRKWLEKNHQTATELIVGYYKVGSGKPSMTWSESVDQALCFGWIDSIRRYIDKDSYSIRFTPRNPKSIWSTININKVEHLINQGLMHEAGLVSYNFRKEDKSQIYSYEKETLKLTDDFEKKFKANKKAWNFFQSLPTSYRKTAIHWVMNAKQETTRLKRLQTLINDSEELRKIKPLNYGIKSK